MTPMEFRSGSPDSTLVWFRGSHADDICFCYKYLSFFSNRLGRPGAGGGGARGGEGRDTAVGLKGVNFLFACVDEV